MRKLIILSLLLAPTLYSTAHPPWGIVVDSHKNIYFADIFHNGRGSVWKLHHTGELELLLRDFHAHNVSLDKDENLITGHGEGTHMMVRINKSGSIDTLFSTTDIQTFFGGNCTWSNKNNRIIYFLGDHKYPRQLHTDGSQQDIGDYEFQWCQVIYEAPNGSFYGTEIGAKNGCVIKIDTNGKSSVIAQDLITKLDRERDKHNDVLLGLTEGCDGHIYVAETAGRRVIKILDNGEHTTFYRSEEHWCPTAIDFFAGDAYIMEYKDHHGYSGPRIIKIDESGSKTTVFDYDTYQDKKEPVQEETPPAQQEEDQSSWLFILSGIGVFILALIAFFFRQRARRRLA